jgi:hypothetical protein
MVMNIILNNSSVSLLESEVKTRSLFNKLNKLRYWLHQSNGLNLRRIIDTTLDTIKTNIKDDEIDNNILGAQYLLDNEKISRSSFDSFIKELPNMKLVYDDGMWHPVNKLNTNYSDLAELLSSILIKAKDQGSLAASNIVEVIDGTNDENTIKGILLKYKNNLHILFEKYLDGPNELLQFTKNIKVNSAFGEKMENDVVAAFEKIGYKLLYQGGDGNFVDMKFSVDIIMETPKGNVKTIQVKSSQNQVEKFLNDYNKGIHKAVDFLVYPEKDVFAIYVLKNNIKGKIPK